MSFRTLSFYRALKLIKTPIFCLGFFIIATFYNLAQSSAEGAVEVRYLVLIDSSASMKDEKQRVDSFFEKARFDDEISNSITLLEYPTLYGSKVSNFRNSAEFNVKLSSLEYLSAPFSLSNILEVGRTWSIEYSTEKRRVIWITDGGGLKKIQNLDTGVFKQMVQIVPLKDWFIYEFSDISKLGNLSKVIGDYSHFDKNSAVTSYAFERSADRTESVQILKDERFQSFRLTRSDFYLLTLISIMTTLFIALLLRTLNRRVQMNRSGKKRQLVLKKIFPKELETNLAYSSNYWVRVPNFWRRPIDNLGDYFALTDARKLKIFSASLLMTFIIAFLLTKSSLIAILVALSFPKLLLAQVRKFLNIRESKNFSEDFPAFISLLSSGLKSGLSLEQGVDAYCSQANGVAAKDFRRVLSEVRMGLTLDESLESLAKRRNDDDLSWLVTAISIQKDVGGSLSTIMDTVLETINGRREVRREVKALSAEGRLSSYVLIALPILIFTFLYFTRKEYVEVLWTQPIGLIILFFIGILITIGWVWMKKVVNIKV